MKTAAEISDETKQVAQSLAERDVENLYELIGRQEKTIERNPALAYGPDLDPPYDSGHMGLIEDVKALGKRVAKRWSHALHDLICGSGNDAEREQLKTALNISEAAAIATVTGLLLPVLSPPIAAAVAVVIVKKFLAPAGEELCEYWKEQLDEA